MDIVLCFGQCVFFIVFVLFDFCSSNAHGLQQVLGLLASFTSLLVMRKGRGSEETGHLLPLGQKVSSYRGAYMVPVFKLSVGMCV